MFEVRTRVVPGDDWHELDARVVELANRPNDFFWSRPDLDDGARNRGWVCKSFFKAQVLMKRLKKAGVQVTVREATGREQAREG